MNTLFLVALIFLPFTTLGQLNSTFSKHNGMSSQTFCFNQDGTYNYTEVGDLSKITNEGTYKLKKDTLILNSSIKLTDIISIKKWKIKQVDSVYISLRLVSGDELLFTNIIVNDTAFYPSAKELENGLLKFPKGRIKSLRVNDQVINWRLKEVNFKIEDENIIEILIDDTKGNAIAMFTDEKFLLKKATLFNLTDREDFYKIQPDKKCR